MSRALAVVPEFGLKPRLVRLESLSSNLSSYSSSSPTSARVPPGTEASLHRLTLRAKKNTSSKRRIGVAHRSSALAHVESWEERSLFSSTSGSSRVAKVVLGAWVGALWSGGVYILKDLSWRENESNISPPKAPGGGQRFGEEGEERIWFCAALERIVSSFWLLTFHCSPLRRHCQAFPPLSLDPFPVY